MPATIDVRGVFARATHAAGHAVAVRRLGGTVRSVKLFPVPSVAYDGLSAAGRGIGFLAGIAAERKQYGRAAGGGEDQQRAERLASELNPDDPAALMAEWLVHAETIVAECWGAVLLVAADLFSEEELSGERVLRLIAEADDDAA